MTRWYGLTIPDGWSSFVYLNFLFTRQPDGTWRTVFRRRRR